jgi:hypothetical protein
MRSKNKSIANTSLSAEQHTILGVLVIHDFHLLALPSLFKPEKLKIG